jgi:general secretion pathway protein F
MSNFAYRAFDTGGREAAGSIEAASRQQALELLKNRGLVPYEIRNEGGPAQKSNHETRSRRQRPLSEDSWCGFIKELSVLMNAELPIDDCLRILKDEHGSTRTGQLSAELLKQTLSGKSLSEALGHQTQAPVLIVSMVRVGENRGKVSGALAELSEFLTRRLELKRKVSSALTYPLLLALAALATLSIIVTTLVPALLPLFEDAGADPPWILASINDLTEFIAQDWVTVVGVLLVVSTLSVLFFRSAHGRQFRDEIAMRLPLVGDLNRELHIAVFARTLGTLLESGVPLVAGMKVAADSVSNRALSASLATVADKLQEGQRFSEALAATAQFSKRSLRFVAVGEEASRLDRMLLHMAKVQDLENEHRINRLVTLLGPLLTIGIAIAVGSLILSVMQALLSVNQLVLK